jgi:hypothetical protein
MPYVADVFEALLSNGNDFIYPNSWRWTSRRASRTKSFDALTQLSQVLCHSAHGQLIESCYTFQACVPLSHTQCANHFRTLFLAFELHTLSHSHKSYGCCSHLLKLAIFGNSPIPLLIETCQFSSTSSLGHWKGTGKGFVLSAYRHCS